VKPAYGLANAPRLASFRSASTRSAAASVSVSRPVSTQ
jgi:hypothetical protein